MSAIPFRTALLASLVCAVISLTGCAFTASPFANVTDEMQAVTLCQKSELNTQIESKIKAEYGFKRFAKNTYRPVIEHQLFGHEVRVVELSDSANKVYAAGNPLEFGQHFRELLPEITCDNNACQAPLGNGQSLFISKLDLKKSKDTTVIECTKVEHLKN